MNEIRKILIIEDEEEQRNNLALLLYYEGYEVFKAETGKEGLEIFCREKPDLVLLDLMLPDGDGFDYLKEMKKTHDSFVIVTTAKSPMDCINPSLQLKCDLFLHKPFGYEELKKGISDVIENEKLYQPSEIDEQTDNKKNLIKAFECPYFTLDYKTGIIKTEINEEQLTMKEFLLLNLLIEKNGEVATHEEIMRIVWRREYQKYEQIIDKVISKLRHKIEKNIEEPRILITVHGIGYKLNLK